MKLSVRKSKLALSATVKLPILSSRYYILLKEIAALSYNICIEHLVTVQLVTKKITKFVDDFSPIFSVNIGTVSRCSEKSTSRGSIWAGSLI